MNTQFLETVFADSIQHPNFFNGRILTATDLRDEQAANLKRSRYLGQAIGAGVVQGLNVTANSDRTALVITGGLAINRRGEGLALPGGSTTVELVISDRPSTTLTSPFQPCDIPAATTLTGVVSTGYYLIAITAATRRSPAMAPHSGLNGDPPSCTHQYEEVGVQFKLVPLTTTDFVSPVTPTDPRSRSRLAHNCFDTYALLSPPTGLSLAGSWRQLEYGLVDELYADQRLTDCDVPLAVFRFAASVVQFVDRWAVRRLAQPALHPQTYIGHPLGQLVSPRRQQEAIAFLLQFQDQITDLLQDPSITPANVAAQDYFEFLPAAGYLPVQVATSDRAFRLDKFFGQTLSAQPLAPQWVRSLFQESFSIDPIRPGIDPVDVYQVDLGTETTYRLFARRQTPVQLTAEQPIEEETPPSTTPTTGDLTVTVLNQDGAVVGDERVSSVRATHQTTGQVYLAKRQPLTYDRPLKAQQAESYVKAQQTKVAAKYADYYATETFARADAIAANRGMVGASGSAQKANIDRPFSVLARPVYTFNDLPTGEYTVVAVPVLQTERGVSSSVTVKTNIDNQATVILRPFLVRPPRDYWIPREELTPDGIWMEGFRINPIWEMFYPGWETDLWGDNPVVDPPPEDWLVFDDPATQLGLEEILVQYPGVDSALVTEGAVIYLHRGYNPEVVTETVVAFAQTPDGHRFPVVPGAADNALDQPATVDRTAIADFDRATVEQLNQAGLGGLDAIASAPTKLVASILGHSTAYSASLIADARTTLQADFQEGYLGYAGITAEQNTLLKAAFPTKVDLANADPATVGEVLGAGVSSSFVNRFLTEVRATVPQEAFALDNLGIDSSGQAALGELGVVSTKDLVMRGRSMEGRTELQAALNVPEATLDRYLANATLNLARGELITAPEKSIGTLAAVPPDVQRALVNVGIGSAKELANANPTDLATTLGFSVAEMEAIVAVAAPYGSKAHLTLVAAATQAALAPEAITEAGLVSAGAIAQADPETLTTLGLDITAAQQVQALSSELLSGMTFRRFQ